MLLLRCIDHFIQNCKNCSLMGPDNWRELMHLTFLNRLMHIDRTVISLNAWSTRITFVTVSSVQCEERKWMYKLSTSNGIHTSA
ncbi:hypothetical protein T08_529 [Trichinella sp. T8]|nr:hypothetical protein T08_529 [Trichinella sp. T8]